MQPRPQAAVTLPAVQSRPGFKAAGCLPGFQSAWRSPVFNQSGGLRGRPHQGRGSAEALAVAEGFEPSRPFQVWSLSRGLVSTAHPRNRILADLLRWLCAGLDSALADRRERRERKGEAEAIPAQPKLFGGISACQSQFPGEQPKL